MAKKTIMELLKEARKKAEADGNPPSLGWLLGYMGDDEGVCYPGIESFLAVHTLDALERIANALEKDQEENSDGETLTYHEFFEEFNAISSEYYARPFNHGRRISIKKSSGFVAATLYVGYRFWNFNESQFNSNELALMAQLATTSPELRGEIDDD